MEHYTAFKKKEIIWYNIWRMVTWVDMWLNLKDVMLSEISQSQKDKYSIPKEYLKE